MKRVLLFAALISLATPIDAQVDPKTHKLCLDARDYKGCVEAMSNSDVPKVKTVEVIEGRTNISGNACPINMAYAGGGKCIEVVCRLQRSGHNPALAGKNWMCKKRVMFEMTTLGWGDASTKATYDPSCPNSQPKIGFNSTCDELVDSQSKKVAPYKR